MNPINKEEEFDKTIKQITEKLFKNEEFKNAFEASKELFRKNKEYYYQLIGSVKARFDKEAKSLPINHDEFLGFLIEKFGHLSFADVIKIKPTREDMLEFDNWVEENVYKKQQQAAAKTLAWKECFISDEHYNKIIELLIDNNKIEKTSLLWKDHEKGWKGFLIYTLKDLRTKGYYKRDIEITNSDYLNFANELGEKIGIDTAKDPGKHDTSFIPPISSNS